MVNYSIGGLRPEISREVVTWFGDSDWILLLSPGILKRKENPDSNDKNQHQTTKSTISRLVSITWKKNMRKNPKHEQYYTNSERIDGDRHSQKVAY